MTCAGTFNRDASRGTRRRRNNSVGVAGAGNGPQTRCEALQTAGKRTRESGGGLTGQGSHRALERRVDALVCVELRTELERHPMHLGDPHCDRLMRGKSLATPPLTMNSLENGRVVWSQAAARAPIVLACRDSLRAQELSGLWATRSAASASATPFMPLRRAA